ncbi:hypothetical protein HUW51_06115 [Adhaeribacter swui]|uniref:Oligosaccharide flippase family protein n=1 Tax=Adhaeribacter swui TaxID=2086471 RepID=A0A7G7G591_9BACT|nr:hypothetical protein [Adhaeribacter swui]QNF32325.1 hypothetical protein HUW51_06115 [Adhaeribacter swui]
MINKIKIFFKNFFTQGHNRTILFKKNIVYSLLTTGSLMVVNLLLVPVTMRYVNTFNYGIWLTFNSLMLWVERFDLGLSNGLKNKLAESNAIGNMKDGKIYVSTTYALLVIIAFIAFVLFLFINNLINWQNLLKTRDLSGISLKMLTAFLFLFYFVQLVVQTINMVLTANHEPAKVTGITLVSSSLCLILILPLSNTSTGSLLELVLILAGIPLLVLILANFWFFNRKYVSVAPKLNFVNFKYARELFNISWLFFIIQLGHLVIYNTHNLIIAKLFGPVEVTQFHVANKYFTIIILVFSVVVAPLWSAFTDAYAKQDLLWIKSVYRKMKMLWGLCVLICTLMLVVSPFMYALWVGDKVKISFYLSMAMVFYTIAYMWHLLHIYLLNGIGKLKLQMYVTLASALVTIPLALVLGKQLGLVGITLAYGSVFLFMGLLLSLQCSRILNLNFFKMN